LRVAGDPRRDDRDDAIATRRAPPMTIVGLAADEDAQARGDPGIAFGVSAATPSQ